MKVWKLYLQYRARVDHFEPTLKVWKFESLKVLQFERLKVISPRQGQGGPFGANLSFEALTNNLYFSAFPHFKFINQIKQSLYIQPLWSFITKHKGLKKSVRPHSKLTIWVWICIITKWVRLYSNDFFCTFIQNSSAFYHRSQTSLGCVFLDLKLSLSDSPFSDFQ